MDYFPEKLHSEFAIESTRLKAIVAISRARRGMSSHRIIKKYPKDSEQNHKRIVDMLRAIGFVTFKINDEFFAILDGPESRYPMVSVHIIGNSMMLHVECSGDHTGVADTVSKIDFIMDQKEGVFIHTAHLEGNSEGVKFEANYSERNKQKLSKNYFYPWIDIPLEEYFDSFMKSDEPILVLFGPPGTGKSTFIRSLIHHTQVEAVVAYDKTVIESPSLLKKFYTERSLKIIAYEDIDSQLKPREDGNFLMASMLNSSDGILSRTDKKIVFSTNLPSAEDIDPALLRKGRCFDVMYFRNLTSEEAEIVVSKEGLPARDLSSKNSWSLSEIMNHGISHTRGVNRFAKRVGFVVE